MCISYCKLSVLCPRSSCQSLVYCTPPLMVPRRARNRQNPLKKKRCLPVGWAIWHYKNLYQSAGGPETLENVMPERRVARNIEKRKLRAPFASSGGLGEQGNLQGASWGLMRAIWESSGGLVGASRGLIGAIWGSSGSLREARKSISKHI